MSSLADRVIIVTGASRGIGEAIAERAARAGARVVISSRKQEGLQVVEDRLRADDLDVRSFACHSGDAEQIDALVNFTVETFGKVDGLVNNAATNPHFGPFLDVEWPAWDKTFEVNVKGYFTAARAVARHLQSRSAPGSIVNMSSVLGLRGGRFQGVYAMTKAAVISMTKTLAIELGPEGIRFNAVAPGFVETKFSAALTDNDMVKQMILQKTPLGRIGQVDDIAPLVVHLLSDDAKFTTGAVFVADGGLLAE